MNGESILAVVNLGCQPIMDFTVEGTHNYITAGVPSHNTGKTIAGSYEVALHLTGRYPDWWQGRVFEEPGAWYAAGSTLETTRDIVQLEMLGKREDNWGTGMVPGADVDDVKLRPNTNGAVDYVMVKHQAGGFARLNS